MTPSVVLRWLGECLSTKEFTNQDSQIFHASSPCLKFTRRNASKSLLRRLRGFRHGLLKAPQDVLVQTELQVIRLGRSRDRDNVGLLRNRRASFQSSSTSGGDQQRGPEQSGAFRRLMRSPLRPTVWPLACPIESAIDESQFLLPPDDNRASSKNAWESCGWGEPASVGSTQGSIQMPGSE